MQPLGPFVLVLGMHRSGTSLLAGCLERCGLWLGDVRGGGRHNRLGYYEIRAVQRLNDEILALNRGSWDDPPARPRVPPAMRRRMREQAEALATRRPCGLKDPRILLLREDWLAEIPAPVALVGTFRAPEEVAASLAARNGTPRQQGLALWLRYNQELVHLHRTRPFPLVQYEMAGYCFAAASAARSLGLPADPARLAPFVSPALAHHQAPDVPEELRQVWDYLREHRVQAPPTFPKTRVLAALQEAGFRAARLGRR